MLSCSYALKVALLKGMCLCITIIILIYVLVLGCMNVNLLKSNLKLVYTAPSLGRSWNAIRQKYTYEELWNISRRTCQTTKKSATDSPETSPGQSKPLYVSLNLSLTV